MKVLVVEDSRFLRAAIQQVLTKQSIDVVTASCGEEALQVIRREAFDLVVLDWVLPRLQGGDILREMKADPATAKIPVLVLSGITKESPLDASLPQGETFYVAKSDLMLTELVDLVLSFATEPALSTGEGARAEIDTVALTAEGVCL